MANKSTLMSEGNVYKKIVMFAFPIFLGNLFQQLYNTVDSLVVGNFVGSDALAAVGSSGHLIFLMIGFVNGLFLGGAGVVIARYYGARQIDNVQKAIHTSIALAIVSGVLLTVIGIFLTPQILRLMGTPSSVLPNSILYFRIYFAGVLAMVLYNCASAIFQSIGDSRHPLRYLIISSVTNVILDLLFVAVLDFGIAGAAYATLLAQFISAILAFHKLSKSNEEYRFHLSKIKFDPEMLKLILTYGIPSGIQNSIIAIANVVVQSNINAFGAAAVAGCGSYSKIEGFGFLPITSFAMSLTTFIAQNLGANKPDRVNKGARFGLIVSPLLAEGVGVTIYLLAPTLISFFNSSFEVIKYGAAQARTVCLFYFLLSFSHCVAGILRGAGKAKVPMYIMLLCWCIIRITYITITIHFINDIRVVFWAYPITWTLSSIIYLIYYKKVDWKHSFE